MRITLSLVLSAMVSLGLVHGAQASNAARNAGYRYLSPVPDAPYCSAQTRFILVRFENVTPSDVINLTTDFINVTGATSGTHTGVAHVASDGRTVIFTMTKDFTVNELVTVTLNPRLDPGASGAVSPFWYQFMITAPMPRTLLRSGSSSPPAPVSLVTPEPGDTTGDPKALGPGTTGDLALTAVVNPNGVSVPSDFPTVTINLKSNPSPGYLFIEAGANSAMRYTMMVDNNGWPVWYTRGRLNNFTPRDDGTISWNLTPSSGGFVVYDQDFSYLRKYVTTNGYLTDGHDFKLLNDGRYLLIGYRVNTVDMSLYVAGGSKTATVTETIIQEFTPEDELIFQWRAWDNYDIRLAGTDFPHLNGLEYDVDGNILVSARHLSEVTKINRDTGEIIWRLSGANSSFTFVDDPLNGTSWQHNITALGDNHYLLFDNGNSRTPQVSRAVEYQLDPANKTARLAWQFRDSPDKYTYWLGNAQRLSNGNTLINFVRSQYPKATEVDANGAKHLELSISPSSDTYRAFRAPWQGAVKVPYLIAEAQKDNVVLVFNKFGDHTVDYYRIYGGTSPAPTALLATSTTTLKHLTNLVNGVRNYFRVTAVSTNGDESGYSNEANLLVNLTVPGQNMVLNGDFAQGATLWTWQVTPPASAQWEVSEGDSHFAITSGGADINDIQLKQAGMKLTQGKDYIFEFDAWSAVPRVLEAKVEANTDGGVNYSGIQPFTITPNPDHYSFAFKMTGATDNNARVVFNAGVLPHDVYLDNVSLRERVYAASDFDTDGCVGFNDLKVFAGQWQKKQSALTADLNGDGKVDFADFVLFSRSWTGDGNCQ